VHDFAEQDPSKPRGLGLVGLVGCGKTWLLVTAYTLVARGDTVVEAALAGRPDVALLDIEMPGGGGLEAAQALCTAVPSCRVVILTTFGRSGYLHRAIESGAVGFLLKDAPAAELASALRRVMQGNVSLIPNWPCWRFWRETIP
jgi:DNA-binding NarL/FixJ family response regulator